MYSIGILLNEIKKHYDTTQDIVNLIVSFNFGFLYLSGPLAAALCSFFGCRKVIMTSAVVFGLSFVASAFFPNIYFTIVIFGFIGG
jgi:MFS family permease